MRLLWEHESKFNTKQCFSEAFEKVTYDTLPNVTGTDERQYSRRFLEGVSQCVETHMRKNDETKTIIIRELLLWAINASTIGYAFQDEAQRRLHYTKLENLTGYVQGQVPWAYADEYCYAVQAVIQNGTDFQRWQVPLYPEIYQLSQRENMSSIEMS